MARLRRPATLDEAVTMLAEGPPGAAIPIAGGVGVSLAMALGAAAPLDVVAIGHLPELRAIERDGDEVLIGAAVTIAELTRADGELPGLLVTAAADVANPGIREVATLAGNLVAGGPASDLLAALLALDARLDLVGPDGRVAHRAIDEPPVPGAIIRSIRVPRSVDGWGWQRLTIRGAMDRSCATVAAAVSPAGWRVALTVAPVRAGRLPAVEAALSEGRDVRAGAAADLASIRLRPDDRASVAHRRRVIPVLIERAVRSAST